MVWLVVLVVALTFIRLAVLVRGRSRTRSKVPPPPPPTTRGYLVSERGQAKLAQDRFDRRLR